ncbi:MAG: trimethylamine methyltransferase family protein [Pirellulales bacterium]|nr:trimethylamine methyltransferase family protein [Pirellulales bacterium]
MISHPQNYLELLPAEDIERILKAALEILDKAGMLIESDEAVRCLLEAGGRQDAASLRVFLIPDVVRRLITNAPPQWILHARNPRRDVRIGSNRALLAPGYGSPFVADLRGCRRTATLDDFCRFALLAGQADLVDLTGGLLVEPSDVPVPLRPLLLTQALVEQSDKPFMGSVAGREGAEESLEIAKIVFENFDSQPCVLGLININSPLRLDRRMAEALVAYVRAGQPVLLTPGILLGITAPATAAGAMAQAFAELLACTALVQAIRPGVPVIIGLGGFGADLRNGGPGFGRPENALATLWGAQLARTLRLPFRCSAAVTGSRRPDIRSGYERMMTAQAAWQAGAHFCLQALGTLDCINSMSYEQFLIDLEIWGYLERLGRETPVDEEHLAFTEIAALPDDFLAAEHTARHHRASMYSPRVALSESFSEWWNKGAADAAEVARAQVEKRFAPAEPPPMAEMPQKELKRYISARRKAILG